MTADAVKDENGGRTGAFSIAAAFAGTLIGAGFASGQELMQFFVAFGARGFRGVALAAPLSAGLGALLMFGARWAGSEPARRGRVLARALDGFMALFFFGLLAVMLAGADSLARSALGAPPLWGGFVMAALTAAAVAAGMRGVLRVFRAVVPVMAAVAAAAGAAVLLAAPGETVPEAWAREGRWTGNWVTASLLFVSYNMLAACAVLGPLGRTAGSGGRIAAGAALGGLGTGGLALILCAAMAGSYSRVADHPLPMLALAAGLHPALGAAYGAALFAGIYTTAVGCLMGFMDRCGGAGSHGRFLPAAVAALALLGSRIGFAQLVSRVYPAAGYAGAAVLAFLAAEPIVRAARKKGGLRPVWIRLPGARKNAGERRGRGRLRHPAGLIGDGEPPYPGSPTPR